MSRMSSPTITLEAYGMDAPDNAEFSAKLPRLTSAEAKNPPKVAEKLNEMSDLLEEIHIKARDNNAILTQMLFSIEERLNRKIDSVREEVIALIDKKFADLAAHKGHNSNIAAASSSTRNPTRKSVIIDTSNNSNQSRAALGSIFESVDSNSSVPTAIVPASKVSNNRSPSFYETIEVVPYAGFVIKTRKLLSENKEKVFVNVFHHDQIEVEPANLPKSVTTTANGTAEDNRPYLVMAEATGVMDKDGHNCLLYNVAVSTEYFKPGNTIDLKITSPTSIRKILHKINLKFNDFLDEGSYSLPRVANGFKGEELPSFKIPVAAKLPPPAPTPTAPAQPTTSSALNKIFSFGTSPSPSPPPTTSGTTNSAFTTAPNTNGGNTVVTRKMSGISDIDDVPDNTSVVSELTSNTGAGRRPSNETSMASARIHATMIAKRRVTRKSIFDTSQFAMNAGNILGRNLLSGDMLDYIREECVDTGTADELRTASVKNPQALLGWQIAITNESDGEMEIFVITDVRKNLLSKTEYRLSRFYQDDIWMKLKRSETKLGVDFRPLRKVLFGLQDEDDDDYSVAGGSVMG